MKTQLTTAVMAAVILAVGAAGAASAQSHRGSRGYGDGQNSRGCYNGERSRDCNQRRRVEQRSNRHYVWRNGRYEDRDGGAAVLGFMLGAAIAGSADDRGYYYSHRHNRGWRSRCSSAYRSFDWRTGTYYGSDGYRHYCVR